MFTKNNVLSGLNTFYYPFVEKIKVISNLTKDVAEYDVVGWGYPMMESLKIEQNGKIINLDEFYNDLIFNGLLTIKFFERTVTLYGNTTHNYYEYIFIIK